MWQIHPLFLEMGQRFQRDNPTLWALIFMNAITENNGTWNTMGRPGFRDDMELDPNMAGLADAYLKEWLPTIQKEFTNFSNTMWGGNVETIKETAEKYDKSGVDGKILSVRDASNGGVIYDIHNDFSYPIEGFIFIASPESINRTNVLGVLV